MITIVTGVPGMGKTSLIVDWMIVDYNSDTPRPFFVMGVPDLKIDHSPCPPVIEWTEKRPDPDDPTVLLDYYTFPKNSIVWVDEAQRVFRPRASGSKVPPHVAAQETHRHTGVDFILSTQKPSLIDANIRELCGRHLHIKNTIMGRYVYEWFEYTDVNNKSNYDIAIKRRFKPPKQAFSLYKSSELHTKIKRPVHKVFFVLASAIAFTIYSGYGLYSRNFAPNEPSVTALKNDALPLQKSVALVAPSSTSQQPVYTLPPAASPIAKNHPLEGFKFYLTAVISDAKKSKLYFDLIKDDLKMTYSNDDLIALGYSVKALNDYSAILTFAGYQEIVAMGIGSDFAPNKPKPVPKLLDDAAKSIVMPITSSS